MGSNNSCSGKILTITLFFVSMYYYYYYYNNFKIYCYLTFKFFQLAFKILQK